MGPSRYRATNGTRQITCGLGAVIGANHPAPAGLEINALAFSRARTPVDFCEWDRRFIHAGLYLDALAGESLTAHVCIDTSGSIDEEELGRFLSELQGILRSYPHLSAFLYYADADLHGPYELSADHDPPVPKGGGGTSFVPFFEAVNKLNAAETQLCIYLTDGWGEFPKTSTHPTLWVVTPGGLAEEEFPFGQLARLVA